MGYFKRTTDFGTYYYNTDLDPIIVIVELDGVYKVKESEHNESWIMSNSNSIIERDYTDKADDLSTYARVGTHPPKPPGTGG